MPKQYGQTCPVARSLEFLGERWTLLIVRDLLMGPRRFQDFSASLSGVATGPHRSEQLVLTPKIHRLLDVGRARAARDQRRLLVEGRVPEAARAVIVGVVRQQYVAAQAGRECLDRRARQRDIAAG